MFYLLLDLVLNTHSSNPITITILKRTTNGSSIVTVNQSLLGTPNHSGDLHQVRIFEGGVVGVELDFYVHCAATLQD